ESVPSFSSLSLHDALPICIGGHDAGAIVVVEDEGPLAGAARQDDLTRPHAPETIAALPALLPQADEPVVVDAIGGGGGQQACPRSEEHTSELQSRENLVCR